MKQLSNNNKTVTLNTLSFTYTSSINSITNEIYLKSSVGECLTWELTQENINLVNSAMLELNLKGGVSIESYENSKIITDNSKEVMYNNIEDDFTLYEKLEDNYTMDEILNAL